MVIFLFSESPRSFLASDHINNISFKINGISQRKYNACTDTTTSDSDSLVGAEFGLGLVPVLLKLHV